MIFGGIEDGCHIGGQGLGCRLDDVENSDEFSSRWADLVFQRY